MSKYDADIHCWSGLLSGDKYDWQEGLRVVCRRIGDAQFHSSMSGYDGWENVAASAIKRRPKSLLLIGHSNGGYAITKIAHALKPYGIDCQLICFDRTMKHCPTMKGNVSNAIDIWAGLRTLQKGQGFRGNYKKYDFSFESHISVIKNKEAQDLAVAFGKRWKKDVE